MLFVCAHTLHVALVVCVCVSAVGSSLVGSVGLVPELLSLSAAGFGSNTEEEEDSAATTNHCVCVYTFSFRVSPLATNARRGRKVERDPTQKSDVGRERDEERLYSPFSFPHSERWSLSLGLIARIIAQFDGVISAPLG